MIAMTGLPSQSSLSHPICLARERWPKDRKSAGPNQRRDRKSSGVFMRYSINHAMGKSQAPINVRMRPTRPINVIIGVTKRNVSDSFIPLMRVMIQKPESFIQGMGLEPQPMAKAR